MPSIFLFFILLSSFASDKCVPPPTLFDGSQHPPISLDDVIFIMNERLGPDFPIIRNAIREQRSNRVGGYNYSIANFISNRMIIISETMYRADYNSYLNITIQPILISRDPYGLPIKQVNAIKALIENSPAFLNLDHHPTILSIDLRSNGISRVELAILLEYLVRIVTSP